MLIGLQEDSRCVELTSTLESGGTWAESWTVSCAELFDDFVIGQILFLLVLRIRKDKYVTDYVMRWPSLSVGSPSWWVTQTGVNILLHWGFVSKALTHSAVSCPAGKYDFSADINDCPQVVHALRTSHSAAPAIQDPRPPCLSTDRILNCPLTFILNLSNCWAGNYSHLFLLDFQE